jgi:hypothetical protein
MISMFALVFYKLSVIQYNPEIICAFFLPYRMILGFDPGTRTFEYDNSDDDDLSWFPITDLDSFVF